MTDNELIASHLAAGLIARKKKSPGSDGAVRIYFEVGRRGEFYLGPRIERLGSRRRVNFAADRLAKKISMTFCVNGGG